LLVNPTEAAAINPASISVSRSRALVVSSTWATPVSPVGPTVIRAQPTGALLS
jgi:hypothetical protein